MRTVRAIIEKKRDGKTLSHDDIQFMVLSIVQGSATRSQAAAFLAFVFSNGLSHEETASLTMAMAYSGDTLSWDCMERVVDKHSTGGVGDKVSLVLAPLWRSLGVRIPMISGRGLGHTGGTLDKLESIPGYRTDLSKAELSGIFDDVGCFICGQTEDLAPADRILYALRNETSTVPCIPLIVASILSKKLAEGISELVMDIKWGTGAFMKTKENAISLAEELASVGRTAGLEMRYVLTETNAPLGRAVGNAIEVQEAIDCLKGGGPVELQELVCKLIGDPRAREVLASGAAYEVWEQMVTAHGGRVREPLLGGGCSELVIEAKSRGVLQKCDALLVGQSSVFLGGGRTQAHEAIDHGVGIYVEKRIGDTVEVGDPLFRILHRNHGLEQAVALLQESVEIV
ncbi:MAG: thymidine phosphorylase [Myxococcota bacterium]|nr:thymidine phosphorylase [Myxococcota bacterium]